MYINRPSLAAVGRVRDTFGCADSYYQSANPCSFCHHNSKLMLWQDSPYKELAMHTIFTPPD